MNNTHCRNWPGDVHVGNEQLCIIYSDVGLGGGEGARGCSGVLQSVQIHPLALR